MPWTPPTRSCLLIAIEGPDMVGKATQAEMLKCALRETKCRVTTEEIPYRDPVTHPSLYEMLRSGDAKRYPDVFQTLHCLNRIVFWKNYAATLAEHHDVIILDRWTLSTLVYGEIGGADLQATASLLSQVPPADFTFVIDAPPFPKASLDSLERDQEFQRRVRTCYLSYCERDPEKYVKIDGTLSAQEVHASILKHLKNCRLFT